MHFLKTGRLRLDAKVSRRAFAGKVGSPSNGHSITIPMFYVNSDPHIGHLYSAVIADAIHRWRQMCDESDVNSFPGNSASKNYSFIVGTDEHGKKIESAARSMGHSPLEHCDIYSARFRDLFTKFNISHTVFSRTTDQQHKRAVQHFWSQLDRGGFIEKNTYEGWYSTIDECFYGHSEVEDLLDDSVMNGRRKVAKESQSPVELIQEENYMFSLGRFKDGIRHWIDTGAVLPEHFRFIAERYIPNSDQAKLSVSRPTSRSGWGIQVPDDPSQTIYVWLDALISYLSAVGYPDAFAGEKVNWRWPPDVQVIGQDILRFHAIYWPAFLMAADLPLPKHLLVHSHWRVDKVKMSKSRGNVVCPFEASQRLSVDGLRYFLLKCGILHEDSNFILQKAIDVINSDLVNDLGNLVQRSVNPKLNPLQTYPSWDSVDLDILGTDAQNLIHRLRSLLDEVGNHFTQFKFYSGINSIAETVRNANAFFHSSTPWKKQLGPEVTSTLFLVYETARICCILLRPVVPEYADRVLTRLGVKQANRSLQFASFNEDFKTRNEESPFGQDDGPIWPRIL